MADAVKSLVEPTAEGECFSSAVCTDGNPYGIREGLICSMPCWSQVTSPPIPSLCWHSPKGSCASRLRTTERHTRSAICLLVPFKEVL